ncbi:MAG: DNA-binding response regulator [Micrococcaceae bacterium]|nr:DNA-binding response regulator [Micrococcaceae bacterium]
MDSSRVAVIIEDDRDIRELIEVVLRQSGFEVHTCSTGVEGVAAVQSKQPDIVTLDLGLPDIDGFEVARRIRLFSDSYIVMLTARAEELDTLLGLEAGADDYLTKPFRPRELRARVAAMLRRPRGQLTGSPSGSAAEAGAGVPASEPGTASSTAPGTVSSTGSSGGAAGRALLTGPGAAVVPDVGKAAGTGGTTDVVGLRHNGLTLDVGTRTTAVDGQDLDLTRTEFELLRTLLEAGRLVRTKADLVRELRHEEYDTGSFISEADERAVEVHIGNLRRKLGDDPKAPRWLETVRGVGYRLAPSRH